MGCWQAGKQMTVFNLAFSKDGNELVSTHGSCDESFGYFSPNQISESFPVVVLHTLNSCGISERLVLYLTVMWKHPSMQKIASVTGYTSRVI
ncbi:hypothetical protein ACHAWF_007240 [Thalassiosira exigua]